MRIYTSRNMKFSLGMPKTKLTILICSLVFTHCLFVSCASSHVQPSLEKSTLSINTIEPTSASLEEARKSLLKKEFEAPLDSEIKWKLARVDWCRGARGSAVENWNWILQFDPNSTSAARVREMTSFLESSREPEIREILGCAKH
jgi:hypothetical protein